MWPICSTLASFEPSHHEDVLNGSISNFFCREACGMFSCYLLGHKMWIFINRSFHCVAFVFNQCYLKVNSKTGVYFKQISTKPVLKADYFEEKKASFLSWRPTQEQQQEQKLQTTFASNILCFLISYSYKAYKRKWDFAVCFCSVYMIEGTFRTHCTFCILASTWTVN